MKQVGGEKNTVKTGEKFSPSESFLKNLEEAQEKKREEQERPPVVNLFFSFDIVNSTQCKTLTSRWPTIIKELLEKIRAKVVEEMSAVQPNGLDCILWRVIGDELVFVTSVYTEQQIVDAVAVIFTVTQEVSRLLKTGQFYEDLGNQLIPNEERIILRGNNRLSIKAAAWIAAINEKIESPYDSICFCYDATSARRDIQEFLGADIDTGFRLKQYTQDRRLVVSLELAYFMIEARKQNGALARNLGKIPEINDVLHILDYVRLKGVWNESLYPVIWYHNEQIYSKVWGLDKEGTLAEFNKSFRYDETENNPIVKNYFCRKAYLEGKQTENACDCTMLHKSLYTVNTALPKIIHDRNLNDKLTYIGNLLKNETPVPRRRWGSHPVELHCAVVCCDAGRPRAMVVQRHSKDDRVPGLWEFGCAKIISEEETTKIATKYYEEKFNIKISLVKDTRREKQPQPYPLALYEITHDSDNNIKKGVILVAKIENPPEEFSLIANDRYVKARWITESEMNEILPEQAVDDFHVTLKTVFKNYHYFFPKGE